MYIHDVVETEAEIYWQVVNCKDDRSGTHMAGRDATSGSTEAHIRLAAVRTSTAAAAGRMTTTEKIKSRSQIKMHIILFISNNTSKNQIDPKGRNT